MLKGLAAGATNIILAIALDASLPPSAILGAAAMVGLLGYGISLALFVLAMRDLGTARSGAYFSTAPFVGALFSVLFLAEPVTWQLLAAAGLMGLGVWLHLTEHHAHTHEHEVLEHEHLHAHDAHHPHDHVPAIEGQHSHRHRHEAMTHSHAHYPDAHHRHPH